MPTATSHTGTALIALSPPREPWRWSQRWRDVLFLHWPVAPDWLREQLPPDLEIDTHAGQAWVSFVAFRLEQVRLAGWPALPLLSNMLELNFRTYVRYRSEPAIYFLSMHANHRLMVAAARWLTPLPYALAKLSYTLGHGDVDFACQPRFNRRPLLAARCRVDNEVRRAEPNSLDAWLLERYVAYVAASGGRMFRMAVAHEPWPWRAVAAQNCTTDDAILPLRGCPEKCHISEGVTSRLWPFEDATSRR